MKYALVIINLILIVFLLGIKIMINNNYFDNNDVFFGSSFLSFQMDYAANFKYIMPVFIITGILSLFLRCSNL